MTTTEQQLETTAPEGLEWVELKQWLANGFDYEFKPGDVLLYVRFTPPIPGHILPEFSATDGEKERIIPSIFKRFSSQRNVQEAWILRCAGGSE